ncbi:hypothetical protein H480_21417 [Amycolatopsis vancoresmycina DSM 44592]|uniref:Uncharacterized protein n=1 Tax=Amycolatopsis vancoresmycina DSM 44592 TaxID=1292037 RepID=R1HSH5_9PSEU|nr:hypothetical protein H480_21417 [Amycolatopsis vancoresmycina DSM 44592]
MPDIPPDQRSLPHGGEVFGGVDPEEFCIPGGGRNEEFDVVEHAEFGGQPDGELQPDGIEGVLPTEVITQQSTVPNDGRRHTTRL